jgi:L-alanine-DL-glutamate epimerase-like enolase superfamily enzyme
MLVGDPLPTNGTIRPPDLPGWGIELDHAQVKRQTANGKRQ